MDSAALEVKMANFSLFLALILIHVLAQSCGYKAAPSDELVAREGEIVGVLIKSNGKADPSSTIELFQKDGESVLSSVSGIDSDGRFGIFPPETGSYNLVGSVGDLDKVIVQNIEFVGGVGMNIGTIQTALVGGLAVKVKVPAGYSPVGVSFNLLGYAASGTTVEEGAGLIKTGIPAGTYTVKFSQTGLQTQLVSGVEIVSGEPTVLPDVSLIE